MKPEKHPTREDLLPLLQLFNSFHPVGKGIEQHILKTAYACNVAKGKYLIKNGEHCDSVYFIKKGMLRGFIKEGNKEITTWFALENELVAAISMFTSNVLTKENIQAIEDCEMFAMKITDLDKLYLKYPSFNIIGRKVMELYYVLAENRAFLTRLHDAQKKYDLFLQLYSHIANRIQLTYIASFLGVTIETLSRVRAKKGSSRKKK
jgi:CRP-like cAMP-binding protein